MDPDLSKLFERAISESADPAKSSKTDDKILDGAMGEVATRGTKGATVDAIARRAGVGRITIFRRFGSKDTLLERLALRELQRFLAGVDAAIDEIDDPAERIVESFAACLRMGTDHALIARIVRREPAVMLERVVRGDPSPLELARIYVTANIAKIQEDAGVPVHRPEEIAEVLIRLALMYAIVPSPVLDTSDEEAVRAFARRVLVPIALEQDPQS